MSLQGSLQCSDLRNFLIRCSDHAHNQTSSNRSVNNVLTVVTSMALFGNDDRFLRIGEIEFHRSNCSVSSISIADHDAENWGSLFGLRDRVDEWKIEVLVFDDLGRSITWFRPTEEVGTVHATGSIH